MESYKGNTYHTGQWPHAGVDFTGQRVGIIGTGSSAVQSVPLIAAQARSLVVFQRTATYSVPARNSALDPAEEARVKADYAGLRARNRQMINAFGSRTPRRTESALAATPRDRAHAFEARWRQGGLYYLGAFGDLILDARANDMAAEFVREKIRATVRDPAVAKLLEPRQPIGCKRLCIDSGYFETFNRPNVRLVDVNRMPIERFTADGLRAGGEELAFDSVVFATGFDAMTGALDRIDIRGRNGVALADKWHAGPLTYLGLGFAGFPNLFIIAGPGSPSVLTNMVVSIEQHVDWIAECIAHLRARPRDHRGEPARRARLGRARERGRQPHRLPGLQLVVPRREHPGQDARVHAAARLHGVRRALRRSRSARLRRICPCLTSTCRGSRPGPARS